MSIDVTYVHAPAYTQYIGVLVSPEILSQQSNPYPSQDNGYDLGKLRGLGDPAAGTAFAGGGLFRIFVQMYIFTYGMDTYLNIYACIDLHLLAQIWLYVHTVLMHTV